VLVTRPCVMYTLWEGGTARTGRRRAVSSFSLSLCVCMSHCCRVRRSGAKSALPHSMPSLSTTSARLWATSSYSTPRSYTTSLGQCWRYSLCGRERRE
jgi:hypothetical protein